MSDNPNTDLPTIDEIFENLRHPSWEIRQQAAKELRERNEPEVLAKLIQSVKEPILSVRIASVEALAQFQDSCVEELLLQSLFDIDWEVQRAAMRSLAQVWGESGLRQMGDNLPEKRIAGIRALAKKAALPSTKPFLAAIDDESDTVCIAAVEVIVKLREVNAIPNLHKRFLEASPTLQPYLGEALLHLGFPLEELSSKEDNRPLYLLPCTECEHQLPPSQLEKVSFWGGELSYLCQFHFEEFIEKTVPFEGKFRKCKWCGVHWPKVEFVDGSCPTCRAQRLKHLPKLKSEDEFRCRRCHKTFPLRSASPAGEEGKEICTRCAYQVSSLSPGAPFFSQHAISFLQNAFEKGYFLCEQSRKFHPLDEMAEGQDFRDPCTCSKFVSR